MAAAALALVIISGLDAVVYKVITSRGVTTTGDEPHYLVVAKALSSFDLHPLAAYLTDLRTHRIFDWPPGSPATNLNLQLYTGPHGPVPTHSLGLSLLLAPFMLFGGDTLPRLALMAFEAAGVIYCFTRACGCAQLSRPARMAFAVVIASPALWLAATQIYPDFLTGVLMACGLVDILVLETARVLRPAPTAVSAVCLALLPWLHQQNLVPAALILVSFTWVGVRTGQIRTVGVLAAVSVLSWLVLLLYNLYAYGHALGLPQPFPSLNKAGVTEILGLLFDRHQGLFVQVPTAAFGLVGLWLARRVSPAAVAATIAASASLLYLNGTFVHAPYGGTSFAGRFEWSSLVPLLVWTPYAICAFARSRARLWSISAAAAVLWAIEAFPIVRHEHLFYNQFTAGSPWDPTTYPGWWMGFDRLLPEMAPGGRLFGQPWFGLVVAILILGGLIAANLALGRVTYTGSLRLAGVTGIAVAFLLWLSAVAPQPLPSGPLVFTDADVGGPVLTGSAPATGPVVTLSQVGHGNYRMTIDYQLSGLPGSGDISLSCASGSLGSLAPSPGTTRLRLTDGNHHLDVPLRCSGGTIRFQMDAGPSSRLVVSDITLAKTGQ